MSDTTVKRYDFAGKDKGDWFECIDGRYLLASDYDTAMAAKDAEIVEHKARTAQLLNEESETIAALERKAAEQASEIERLNVEVIKRNQYKINQEYLDNTHAHYEAKEAELKLALKYANDSWLGQTQVFAAVEDMYKKQIAALDDDVAALQNLLQTAEDGLSYYKGRQRGYDDEVACRALEAITAHQARVAARETVIERPAPLRNSSEGVPIIGWNPFKKREKP